MKITTLTEARALVGRTFERDGNRLLFDDARKRAGIWKDDAEVYARLISVADMAEFGWWWNTAEVNHWLSAATEVK